MTGDLLIEGPIHMKFSMTGLENSDLLIEVTAWTGLTEILTFISSFGTTKPQPSSQCTGFLGLCSHSCRCAANISSFITAAQPYPTLSHVI
jgi:hypothetical protein